MVIERKGEMSGTHYFKHYPVRCVMAFCLPWFSACHNFLFILYLSLSSLASPHLLSSLSLALLLPLWFFHSVPPSPSIIYPIFWVSVFSTSSLSLAYPYLCPHYLPHAEPYLWEDHGYIHPSNNPSTKSSILSFPFCNSLFLLFIHLFLPKTYFESF